MKTKALRLYGKNDLRLEEFDLPAIKPDEILARVVSDSICMSSYKAAIQGADHKRVPNDVANNPVMLGHEFCGELLEVGDEWKSKFMSGQKFTIQPALNYKGSLDAPGYSYKYIGGCATHIIIPREVMELDCLLPYNGDAYFSGSLTEPMSCIIGAFHASYHTRQGVYTHDMGIVEGGIAAILGGAGPMGLGAVDYLIHCGRKPRLLVVTDIVQANLDRAAKLITVKEAEKNGVRLIYINTSSIDDVPAYLKGLTDGQGYDDVFVYNPLRVLVEMGDAILGRDGCMNFFAGPTDPAFAANFNFYNVHYASTHIVGTSGGNTDDMKECIHMMEKNLLRPETMLTHVGGLDSAAHTTLNLTKIPGGKKLIYTGISMELTAIADMKGELGDLVAKHDGLWNAEAEKFLLEKYNL